MRGFFEIQMPHTRRRYPLIPPFPPPPLFQLFSATPRIEHTHAMSGPHQKVAHTVNGAAPYDTEAVPPPSPPSPSINPLFRCPFLFFVYFLGYDNTNMLLVLLGVMFRIYLRSLEGGREM
jgi:hypothetical protein